MNKVTKLLNGNNLNERQNFQENISDVRRRIGWLTITIKSKEKNEFTPRLLYLRQKLTELYGNLREI